MQPLLRLSLATVVLLVFAACSSGQSSQPETTTTTNQTTTTAVSTTSTVAASTTTTIAVTSTTVAASTTTVDTTTTTIAATTTTAAAATTTTVAPATTTTAQSAGRQLNITIAGFQYSGDMSGRVGDTVRVVNNDLVAHTWTAKNGAFDSGSIGGGQDYFFTFNQPGTFEFFCEPHPGMVGTITITS